MTNHIQVYKTYQYRLYRCDKRDKQLDHKIDVAGYIWNHFVALQRRCYRLTGKYITLNLMKNHVLKLRKTKRFAFWQSLYSQACQNVCSRVDDGYQRFFKGINKRPPVFKKIRKYKSFTFPQGGYKVESNTVTIDGIKYKFVKHREMEGRIKTLTVKRDSLGHFWLFFSVIETMQVKQISTGKSGGFDFGLKLFLTDDEGRGIESPQFYREFQKEIAKRNRQLAKKKRGSKNRQYAKCELGRLHQRIANKRREHHFQLAHTLCSDYDTLYFEDLNIAAMKRLWGRKVSDLGFTDFLEILKWVAVKRGKEVVEIGRFEATTKTCHNCQEVNDSLMLHDREWTCPNCGLFHNRDHNAAINIKTIGASMVNRSASKTRIRLRGRDDGSSPSR